jgi:hypothetical protein
LGISILSSPAASHFTSTHERDFAVSDVHQ